jgi:hypothetical protein
VPGCVSKNKTEQKIPNMNDNIVDFNNRGIVNLLTGNDDEAIRNFRSSLALLRLELGESSVVDKAVDQLVEKPRVSRYPNRNSHWLLLTCSNQKASWIQTIERIDSIICCEGSKTYHLPISAKLEKLQEGMHGFVYTRPLAFIGHLSLWDLDHFLQIHSAVVIFNMALAHHRKSKVTGSRKLLDKANILYGMCAEVLEHDEIQHRIVVLIKSAALNNKSQLCFEIGDHFEAQKGFDQLSALLLGQNGSEILTQFDEEALEGFLLNLMLLKPCVVAAAA